jgi:hypothetical protein
VTSVAILAQGTSVGPSAAVMVPAGGASWSELAFGELVRGAAAGLANWLTQGSSTASRAQCPTVQAACPPCVLDKEGDVYLVVVVGFLFSAGGVVLFIVAFLLGRWSVKTPASTKRLVRDDRNLL